MQKQQQIINKKNGALFTNLLVLTALFILVEISFLIECSGMYLGDFHLIASHLKVPALVIPGIVYFVFAQLLVHFAFLIIVWGIAKLVGIALDFSEKKTEQFGIGLWFFCIVTVFIANRAFFPNSKYSAVFLDILSMGVAKLSVIFLAAILSLVLLVAAYGLFIVTQRRKVISSIMGVAVLGSLTSLFFIDHHSSVIIDAATEKKPNIIIIGVDSLRPDFLGFFGYEQHTPHFDQFLNHATVFAEAVTPIARTYPSWVSILTGEYPKTSNVRTNLSDQSHLDLSTTIPAILQKRGYKTIFATDETRFSNIDQHFGFDEAVTPPIGINDFLLGTLNDFPFSNLIVNTVIGKYLFPHSYGSRPVFVTYEPDSFLKLVAPVLAEPRHKPVFLVTHFCLTHYPYAWANLPVNNVTIRHYNAAVAKVDQQFDHFMQLLKKDKLLEHSIVILLSDHGEAVEISGDRITNADLFVAGKNNQKRTIPRFYPASSANETVDKSGGHGTDVLGLSQYHTLLAFRSYGIKRNQEKTVPGLVSLMDIKPTLLQFLNLPLEKVNGYSLRDVVFGGKSAIGLRSDFFIESDFSPEAIRTVHPEARKVLFEGIDYFKIDQATARVVVKDSMLKLIVSSKQYADFYGPWILALYPQKNKTMTPILVNLKTGQWTNDLSTDFAKQAPSAHMLHALKNYYGNELTPIKTS